MERRLALPYFWDAMARSARGIVNAYTLGGQHGLWRQAERVLAPTLLVYGGRDQLVAYRMAQRAARAFRDSRLLTLPDAGHVAMMEYPETVATAFRELLADSGELTRRTTATDRCGELRRDVGRHSRRGRADNSVDKGKKADNVDTPATRQVRQGRQGRRQGCPEPAAMPVAGRGRRGYGRRSGFGAGLGGPDASDGQDAGSRGPAAPGRDSGTRSAAGVRRTARGRNSGSTAVTAPGGYPGRGHRGPARRYPAVAPVVPRRDARARRPQVRGGHPEQREPGGAWGQLRGGAVRKVRLAPGPGKAGSRRASRSADTAAAPDGRAGAPAGPRQRLRRTPSTRATTSSRPAPAAPAHLARPLRLRHRLGRPRAGRRTKPLPQVEEPEKGKGGKGRTFTGIAAAAVTTVLAVVVAGQVADAGGRTARADDSRRTRAVHRRRRPRRASTPRPAPSASAAPSATPLTYDAEDGQEVPARRDARRLGEVRRGPRARQGARQGAEVHLSRRRRAGPRPRRRSSSREAVQKTLNDDRSWAHDGGRTFERISSGKPDFVITLASPGTTGDLVRQVGPRHHRGQCVLRLGVHRPRDDQRVPLGAGFRDLRRQDATPTGRC